jgi:hypothetical protein
VRASVTGTFALTILLLAVASGHAQAPPLPPQSTAGPPQPAPGFVSAYEIMHTLRSAGFDPVAPPLREGTTYVARATDYRGILMRVVLDARTGAIRDANRIVPRSGNFGEPYGEADDSGPYDGPSDETYVSGPYGPEPYGPGPNVPPSYGPPPYGAASSGQGGYGRVGMVRPPYAPPAQSNATAMTPATARSAAGVVVPPLPRPRPAVLASSKQSDSVKTSAIADPKLSEPKLSEPKPSEPKPSAAIDPKPASKPDAAMAGPTVPTVPTAQAPAAVPPARAPAPAKPTPPLSINN